MHRFDWLGALLVGAAFGLAIYVFNYYVIAPVVFPWFVDARTPTSALIHLVFGAVIGAAYVGLRKPRRK